jgi:hypothetical protein
MIEPVILRKYYNLICVLKRFRFQSITFCLVIFVQSFFIDKYTPITEGLWHVYIRWLSLGYLPYRDFELLVPPGFPYFAWLTSTLFGDSFLSLRIVGLLIAGGIGVLLFQIASRLICPRTAVFLSLLVTTYLYSGSASVWFDYNYFAVFSILIVLNLFNRILIPKNPETSFREIFIRMLPISAMSFFVLLIKQTFGFALIVAISLVFIIFFFDSLGKPERISWSKKLSSFSAQLCIFGILFASLLVMFSAFNEFGEQVLQQGDKPKGSLGTILFAWINPLLQWSVLTPRIPFLGFLFIGSFLLTLISKSNLYSVATFKFQRFRMYLLTLLSVTLCVALNISSTYSENDFTNFMAKLSYYLKSRSYIEFFYVGVIFVFAFFISKQKRNMAAFFIGVLAFTLGTGMSGGISEYGSFFLLFTFLVYLSKCIKVGIFRDFLVPVICIVLTCSLMVEKAKTPYSWWGYTIEKVSEQSEVSSSGLTAGLMNTKINKGLFEQITSSLQRPSGCGNGSLVYPAMPLFQLEVDQLPRLPLATYWFDFSTKSGLSRVSADIQLDPPSTIVIVDVPKFVIEGHRNLFRNGMSLPQEDFRSGISNLIAKQFTRTFYLKDAFSIGYDLSIYEINCKKLRD